jgi:hypothetical protein
LFEFSIVYHRRGLYRLVGPLGPKPLDYARYH